MGQTLANKELTCFYCQKTSPHLENPTEVEMWCKYCYNDLYWPDL